MKKIRQMIKEELLNEAKFSDEGQKLWKKYVPYIKKLDKLMSKEFDSGESKKMKGHWNYRYYPGYKDENGHIIPLPYHQIGIKIYDRDDPFIEIYGTNQINSIQKQYILGIDKYPKKGTSYIEGKSPDDVVGEIMKFMNVDRYKKENPDIVDHK
jgi:hypothetical protein